MSHKEDDVTPEELEAARLKIEEQLKDKRELTPSNASFWLD